MLPRARVRIPSYLVRKGAASMASQVPGFDSQGKLTRQRRASRDRAWRGRLERALGGAGKLERRAARRGSQDGESGGGVRRGSQEGERGGTGKNVWKSGGNVRRAVSSKRCSLSYFWIGFPDIILSHWPGKS